MPIPVTRRWDLYLIDAYIECSTPGASQSTGLTMREDNSPQADMEYCYQERRDDDLGGKATGVPHTHFTMGHHSKPLVAKQLHRDWLTLLL